MKSKSAFPAIATLVELTLLGLMFMGLMFIGYATNTATANQLGGWSQAEVDNPAVVAAANFAVKETQKNTPKLKLVKIVAAKKQLVAGMNYWVKLELKDSSSGETIERQAEAVIYVNLDDVSKLTSWKWVKQED